MSEEYISDPIIRLFLSVDIVGSTRLKEKYSHNMLLRKYYDRSKALKTTCQSCSEDNDFFGKDENIIIQTILSDFSKNDSDWADILSRQLEHFHSKFQSNYYNKSSTSTNISESLWKLMGDELIYAFSINNLKQLHELVYSFLLTLRYFDKEAIEKDKRKADDKVTLRLKGTGWTAGFPIRNREVKFLGDLSHPQLVDYLGPDIDIGFRLGKHSYPGFICVSMDLAYLLGNYNTSEQMVGLIVGWSRLKGVWDDNPYPIIWISLPQYYEKSSEDDEKNYDDLRPWASYENDYANEWEKKRDKEVNSIRELKEMCSEIDRIRDHLPPSLGQIPPYILEEEEYKMNSMPNTHRMIHKILLALSEGDAGEQGDTPTEQVDAQQIEDEIKENQPSISNLEEKLRA